MSAPLNNGVQCQRVAPKVIPTRCLAEIEKPEVFRVPQKGMTWKCKPWHCGMETNATRTKCETRMTASVLKQDPNTEKVERNGIY